MSGGWPQPSPFQQGAPFQQPAQGWPPPGYGGRRRPPAWVWAAVALTAVVVVVGVILLVTVGGKSEEDKVRAALGGLFAAYNDEDYDGWRQYFCNRSELPDESDWLDYRDEDGPVEIEITSVRVDDDEARASVRVTTEAYPDDPETSRFEFQHRDGEWLVCYD